MEKEEMWEALQSYCLRRIEASKNDKSGTNEEHSAEERAYEDVLEWVYLNI